MGRETLVKIKTLVSDVCKMLFAKKWVVITLLLLVAFFVFKFCFGKLEEIKMGISMMQPSLVEVEPVQLGTVDKQYEFSGRVEAQYSVDLIARVQGFLQKSYFKEGDFVKKGQLLFLIEPSEYQIAVKNAQAAVNATNASLINAEKNLKRAKELVKQDFVSKSYYDEALASRDSYKGSLDVNKAQLAQAKLNLSYTRIVAPVDGKIGKILITQGNLVNLTKGTIAKLISTNPIYVTFNLKSEDYLSFKRADSTDDVSNTVVLLKLSDGTMYPKEGKIEFIDNAVDASAGTITMRATFDNPDGLLLPADFVTVYLKAVNPRKELLVPMESVQDSTDGFFVYVVSDKPNKTQQPQKKKGFLAQKWEAVNNKFMGFVVKKVLHAEIPTSDKYAVVRQIKATEQYKGFWIVEDGLKEGEIVLVKGITQLSDGQPIKIKNKS